MRGRWTMVLGTVVALAVGVGVWFGVVYLWLWRAGWLR